MSDTLARPALPTAGTRNATVDPDLASYDTIIVAFSGYEELSVMRSTGWKAS